MTQLFKDNGSDGDSQSAHTISADRIHIFATGSPWEAVVLIPKIESSPGSDTYIPISGKELGRTQREVLIETNGSAGCKLKLQQVNSNMTGTSPSITADVV